MIKQDTEDPRLYESDENDALEAQQLGQSTTHFHEALEAVPELQNRVDASTDGDGLDNLNPDVCVFWTQAVETVGACMRRSEAVPINLMLVTSLPVASVASWMATQSISTMGYWKTKIQPILGQLNAVSSPADRTAARVSSLNVPVGAAY